MATKEQTRANKENAKRSSGPRTAAGKAKSSQNAFKHGLRAQATVLPDENLDDFEFLSSELEDQFQPQTAVEWNLLRQLADAEWRMRRVPCLEAALLAAKLNETVRYYGNFPERLPEDDAEADMVLIGAAAESDASGGDTFSKLSRYEARLSYRYFKALEHLQKNQSLRKRAAEPENRPPAVPGSTGPGAHETAANGKNANETNTNGTGANGTGANGAVTRPGNGHDGSEVGDPAEPIVSRAAARGRISCKHAKAGDRVTIPIRREPARPQPPSPVGKAARPKALSARKPTSNQRDRKLSEPKMPRPPQARQTNPISVGRKQCSARGTGARGTVTRRRLSCNDAKVGGRVTVPARHAHGARGARGTVTRRKLSCNDSKVGGRVTVPARHAAWCEGTLARRTILPNASKATARPVRLTVPAESSLQPL
jgi:hypothetical protein